MGWIFTSKCRKLAGKTSVWRGGGGGGQQRME